MSCQAEVPSSRPTYDRFLLTRAQVWWMHTRRDAGHASHTPLLILDNGRGTPWDTLPLSWAATHTCISSCSRCAWISNRTLSRCSISTGPLRPARAWSSRWRRASGQVVWCPRSSVCVAYIRVGRNCVPPLDQQMHQLPIFRQADGVSRVSSSS